MDMHSYLRNLIVVIPVFLFVLIIFPPKSEKNEICIGHKLLAVLLCIYMLGVAIVTGVTPLSGFSIHVNLQDINWDLVGGIREMMAKKDSYGYINVFGNILLFVPLGIFLPLLSSRNRNFLKVTLYGFFTSLLIEAWQLFLIRGTDVMDLFLNTIGAMLGYLIFVVIYKVVPKVVDAFGVKTKNDHTKKIEQKEIAAAMWVPFIVTIIWGFIDAYRFGLHMF